MQVYDRFFVENGYLEQVQGWGSGTHYRATKKGQDNPVITNKLSKTLMVRSASYFERNFTQKAQKEQFGVSKARRCRKVMRSISTTGRIPIPKIMTGNLIPGM